MSVVNITVNNFREAFPEFADANTYPDAYLQRFLDEAQCYISTRNFRIRPAVRVLAIEYMAGHLMTLSATDAAGNPNADAGNGGLLMTSAHIDGVSVSMQAPIASDAFSQWVQSTAYGRKFWALLTANNPTGVFWIGSPRAFGIR